MGLVLGLAVAIAALRNADDHWAGGLLLATAVLLGVAAFGAVHHAGRRRAGRLGFAVFGGKYFALLAPFPLPSFRLLCGGVGYVLPSSVTTSSVARGAHGTPHNRSNHGPPRKPIRPLSGGETTKINGLLCSPTPSLAIRTPIRVIR